MTDLQKALADPVLTREKLFALYAEAVRAAWTEAEVSFSAPDTLRMVVNGKEQTAYLENLWRMCRDQTAEERLAVVQRHIRALREAFTDPKSVVTRENIIPIIKDSEYFTVLKDVSVILRDHFVGDLWIVYAVDLPDSTRSLSAAERDALGIVQSELRAISLANLTRILPEIERHGEGPWYLLTAGGDYVASLLLLDAVWEQLQEDIDGDIVAVVPARDVLLFTSSKSKEGLVQIRDKARDITEGGHHVISQTLLRRTDAQWKVFE